MGRYARAVANYPYLFVLVNSVLSILAGSLTVWVYGTPNLDDPFRGFEPRGTLIKGWTFAGTLINNALQDGNLSLMPGASSGEQTDMVGFGSVPSGIMGDADLDINPLEPRSIPRMVVKPVIEGANLLDISHLRAICDIEEQFIEEPCGDKCITVSLPRVLAEMYNTKCRNLTEEHIQHMVQLVGDCAKHYFSFDLTRPCVEKCQRLDPRCTEHDFVYQILNDFTDQAFLKDGDSRKNVVTYSTIFIMWNSTKEDLEMLYRNHLNDEDLQIGNVSVVAQNLLIQRRIFKWQVKQDLVWYALAMALVVVVLVFYLRSVVLMLTIVLNVAFTLGLSYWFYIVVCRFTFFPFINILAGLLLIALGADDLFIFHDIWQDEKSKNSDITYEHLVDVTLYHGGISVFVTSFTTAAALLANLINDVSAIRCFGAFAAICVLFNFVLFITWVPAILVITDYCYDACVKKEKSTDWTLR